MQEIKKINLSLEKIKTVTLADVSINNKGEYGIGASAVDYSDELYTYLRITDINDDGTLNKNDLKSVDDVDAKNYLLNENDVVFARTGNSTGKAYYYDKMDGELVYAGFLIKFSLDSSKINPKFMKYYVLSKDYKGWVNSMCTGSTRPNINAKMYGNMELILPPREQQDFLVNILGEIDNKIEINKMINKNLEQLSQILFKKWLTDFDLKNEFSISEPFKESNLGKIPESWEIKTIGDLSDVKGRIGWRGYTTNDLVDDGPWVVGGKEITSGFIDFNSAKHLTREKYEESPEIMLKDKDLIIAKTGTIGPIAMFYEIYGDATLNPNVGLIRSKMIAPALLLTFFKTPRAQYYLNEFTTSSVQPAINQTTIKQLEVAIPSDKQLLEKIGNKFEEINLLQFNLNEEIKKLQKLRDTLLPKLMSGEIDVSEVNCDLELKYNYMKYLFNQIHTPMSKSVV